MIPLLSRNSLVRYRLALSLLVMLFLQTGKIAVAFAAAEPPVIVSSSPVAAEPPAIVNSPVAVATGAYIIGPADRLEVMLWKEQDLSREIQVRVDGWISLPLIGDVEAAGKTIDGLTKIVSELYSKVVEDPSVTIILRDGLSYRYYMIGKVKNPGEFKIDMPVTVLQAIARSGGFAEWAKTDDVLLVRKRPDKQEITHFDYDAFVKGKNLDKNIEIAPGDIIVVP
ncbi:MAG: hypothetical protein A2511_11380 [Deltaproteobacteria bacterium RIFOXYD12_FULL_50_9]|nr:MAG: hypothetical protein A2511_11380 [Deltaproteobacteria bacterium RIFOXYD12_FULL_50_9]